MTGRDGKRNRGAQSWINRANEFRRMPRLSLSLLMLSVLGRKFDDVFHGRDAHATWRGRPARGLNTFAYLWRSILSRNNLFETANERE
jgi:hypothetical protein